MGKLLLAVALVTLTSATPALATQSRIDAMGGGTKLVTVEDDSNIFGFPSLLVRHGNMVYVDNLMVASDFPAGRFGFHYNLSDDTVLAFFGANLAATDRAADAVNAFAPTGNLFTGFNALGVATQARPETGIGGFDGNVDYRVGTMFATVLGASTRFGVSFHLMGANNDREQPAGELSDRGGLLFDFGVGLGLDFDGSELEIAAGVEIGVGEDAADDGTGALADAFTYSHFGLRLNGRWTFDFFDQTKIVTFTQFQLGSQSVEDARVGGTSTASYDGIAFTLGADLRIEPFEDVAVSPGLGFRIANYTQETESSVPRDSHQAISLPFYGIGVDLKVAKWLDVRFGAQQSVDLVVTANTTGGVTTENNTTETRTSFDMGVGLHIPVSDSTLTIDLSVNPDFLINGPDFVTGSPTSQFVANGAIHYAW